MRWLCDLVGYGEGSFGLLTSGGVMANFIAMALVRDVHLRRAHRRRPAAARGGARGRPRLRQRPDPLLDRPRARRAGLPARDARRRSRPTTRSGSTPRPWPRPSPRDRAAGLRPVAIAAVAGLDEHGLGRPRRRSSPRSPRARACGSTSTRRTAARPACPPATRTASRASTSPTASPSTPTSGSSRPTTSARCSSATARHLRQAFDRSPEYYRGGEAAAGAGDGERRPRDADDDHAGQLNFYKLGFEGTRRFRALKLWATWKHLGTSGLGRLIERNDDVAAYLAARCAEADDLEALPDRARAVASCASATCRAARRPPRAMAPARPRRPPGPARAALEAVRRRLAVDDLACAARPGCAPAIVNYLTTEADIDRLLATLRRLA